MGKMLKAEDVAEILQIGLSKSYQIIKQLNQELEKAGYYTCRGRVSADYFEKRFFGKGDDK